MKLTHLLVPAMLALAMSATSAVALTKDLEPPTRHTENCKVSSVSGATACSGVWNGNDSNQDLTGFFGEDNWTEVLKLDASRGTETSGDTTLIVSNVDESGSWSLTGYGAYSSLMFVLKGGPSFSAFLMEPASDILAGVWDNESMFGGGKNNAGLSHWTVYGVLGQEQGETPPAVPLPGAGLLMLGGFGTMAVYARRRKANRQK